MNYKTIFLATGATFLLGAGAIGVSAAANPTFSSDWKAVQTAIINKDLAAFKDATIQSATNRANSVTQEELNKMSDRAVSQQVTQDAISNNDYEAFKKVADSKILEQVNSQAEFNQLVSRNKTKVENQSKVNDAVKNNDFEAYKNALTTQFIDRPMGKMFNGKGPEFSDAQLKTRFDEQVAQYKADGTLPGENNFMGMGRGGFKGGRGGHGRGMMMGGFER
jgi:hypothetical protein